MEILSTSKFNYNVLETYRPLKESNVIEKKGQYKRIYCLYGSEHKSKWIRYFTENKSTITITKENDLFYFEISDIPRSLKVELSYELVPYGFEEDCGGFKEYLF